MVAFVSDHVYEDAKVIVNEPIGRGVYIVDSSGQIEVIPGAQAPSSATMAPCAQFSETTGIPPCTVTLTRQSPTTSGAMSEVLEPSQR